MVAARARTRGEVVITDRYVDSTLAYQGAGRALDAAELEWVARWATGDLRPHLTVLLDLEPGDGLTRFEERDRIEGESLEFHQRVRDGVPAPWPRPTPTTTSCSTPAAAVEEIADAVHRRLATLLQAAR